MQQITITKNDLKNAYLGKAFTASSIVLPTENDHTQAELDRILLAILLDLPSQKTNLASAA